MKSREMINLIKEVDQSQLGAQKILYFQIGRASCRERVFGYV